MDTHHVFNLNKAMDYKISPGFMVKRLTVTACPGIFMDMEREVRELLPSEYYAGLMAEAADCLIKLIEQNRLLQERYDLLVETLHIKGSAKPRL